MSDKLPDRKRLLARTANWRKQKTSEQKQPKVRQPLSYPIVRVEKSLANPGFAKLVEQVVGEIDFADARFSPELQQFLQLIARDGAKATESTIQSMSRVVHGRANLWETLRFAFEIGDRIISELALLSKEELFPFNDVEVRFLGKSVVLGL